MDNSVYIALSRQMAAFRHLDAKANNIANANTTGFQAEQMLFTDYLVDDGNRHKMSFLQDVATYHTQEQGALQATGNPLDVAIEGDGYFVLEIPGGGRAYTRAGNFQLDGNGVLVNHDGLAVLDDGGNRIQFEDQDSNITFGQNGILLVDGQERAALGLAEFQNPQNMQQLGGAMLTSEGEPPRPAINSRVLHGMLEDSNVSAVMEVVDLTKVSRGVSNTSKFIEVMYDLQRKANNAYAKNQGG